MKLGLNLYSIRKFLQSEADMKETFQKLHDIGYEVVQLSGAAPLPAETVKAISEETNLPIVCTHSPIKRILEDTDALIRDHQTYGCNVIGLGSLPTNYRKTESALRDILAQLREPVKKINAAGMHFAYHNHNFEFDKLEDTGRRIYDIMLEECTDWQFILDTYWVMYGGDDVIETMRRVGKGRLTNVHFKDMSKDESREICSCGSGRLDFASFLPICRELGTENILVEQDNANDKGNPFGEVENSFKHLRPIVK